jgi:hypothetical protein
LERHSAAACLIWYVGRREEAGQPRMRFMGGGIVAMSSVFLVLK